MVRVLASFGGTVVWREGEWAHTVRLGVLGLSGWSGWSGWPGGWSGWFGWLGISIFACMPPTRSREK